jgi:hypothetical protein
MKGRRILDPLHEQALRRINRLLEVLKALIAAAKALESREAFNEEALAKAVETVDKARADFHEQTHTMEALTVYLVSVAKCVLALNFPGIA